MGMGMPGEKRIVAVPDVFGLPVYNVSKVVAERDGDTVRIVCGSEMFGQQRWDYVVVMSAADLLLAAKQLAGLAQDAFNEKAIFGPDISAMGH